MWSAVCGVQQLQPQSSHALSAEDTVPPADRATFTPSEVNADTSAMKGMYQIQPLPLHVVLVADSLRLLHEEPNTLVGVGDADTVGDGEAVGSWGASVMTFTASEPASSGRFVSNTRPRWGSKTCSRAPLMRHPQEPMRG